MPTYEFRCPNGHEFEHLHRRISDAPTVMKCPECGAEAERLISGGAGLLFKGSGFYITDYRGEGYKKAAQSESGGSSSSGGEGKSESKSEPAAAPKSESKSSGSSSSGGSGSASGGTSKSE